MMTISNPVCLCDKDQADSGVQPINSKFHAH